MLKKEVITLLKSSNTLAIHYLISFKEVS